MVRTWRIVKARHASRAFTGEGAQIHGGRWNSPGTALVYTAGSPALAALEMLVHLDAHEVLRSYVLVEVAFAETLVEDLDLAQLPRDWRRDPAPLTLRALGDDWAKRRSSPVLRVPSVLVPEERNYLLNPVHPDFAAITHGSAQSFAFNPRLIKKA